MSCGCGGGCGGGGGKGGGGGGGGGPILSGSLDPYFGGSGGGPSAATGAAVSFSVSGVSKRWLEIFAVGLFVAAVVYVAYESGRDRGDE
jgi:hypothetical protein